jgi:hypothetical protein
MVNGARQFHGGPLAGFYDGDTNFEIPIVGRYFEMMREPRTVGRYALGGDGRPEFADTKAHNVLNLILGDLQMYDRHKLGGVPEDLGSFNHGSGDVADYAASLLQRRSGSTGARLEVFAERLVNLGSAGAASSR